MGNRTYVIGRIVHFADTDDAGNKYCVPAIITATPKTVKNVEFNQMSDYALDASAQEVHLTVYSPDPLLENEGVYQEHCVSHDSQQREGTYHWADECR
jgi:hypothetical protein